MRNAVMLIHDGSWPDIYLNLSTFFGNVGIFVYDNREIGQSVPANFKGISTFIYLISSSKMLQKLRETTSLPQTSGLILSGKFQGYLSSISPIAADARAKIFCSDDVSNIMDFSLRLFASGETGRYRTLSGLYSIFNKNQLVPSYYCAQYMDLSPEEWKNIISKIAKAVREFEHSRDLPNIEYVFFSSGLGMKRANDICRKVFKQTQTKWSLLSEQQALLFDEKRILTKLEAAYRADDDLKLALMFLNDISQRLRPSIERAQRVFEICLEAPMIYYVYYGILRNGVIFRRRSIENGSDVVISRIPYGLAARHGHIYYVIAHCRPFRGRTGHILRGARISVGQRPFQRNLLPGYVKAHAHGRFALQRSYLRRGCRDCHVISAAFRRSGHAEVERFALFPLYRAVAVAPRVR